MPVEINLAEITDAELEECYLQRSRCLYALPIELFIGKLLAGKGIRMNGWKPAGSFAWEKCFETQTTKCRQIIDAGLTEIPDEARR